MSAGAIAAVLYALGWLLLFRFRVEALRVALPRYEGAERTAVRLAPIVLSLHVTLACLWLGSSPLAWRPRLILAALLWLAALAFWFWGRLAIGPARRRLLPDEPPLAFRQDGPFGIVRHPLYASYAAAALAPVLATASPLLAVTFAASFALIALRAVQEEVRLRAQLGPAYDSYCRRVKRLVPFVW